MKKRAQQNLAVFGCLAAAGFATRALLEWAWEHKTDKPAPKNPSAPGVSWSEALGWGAAAGIIAGLTRTVVRRGYSKLSDGGHFTDV